MNLDYFLFAVENQKKTISGFAIFGIIVAPFLALLGYGGASEPTLPIFQRVMACGLMMIGVLMVPAVLYEYFVGKKFQNLEKHPVIEILKNHPEDIAAVREVGSHVFYAGWEAGRFTSLDFITRQGKTHRLPVERRWLPKIYEEIKKACPDVEFGAIDSNLQVRV